MTNEQYEKITQEQYNKMTNEQQLEVQNYYFKKNLKEREILISSKETEYVPCSYLVPSDDKNNSDIEYKNIDYSEHTYNEIIANDKTSEVIKNFDNIMKNAQEESNNIVNCENLFADFFFFPLVTKNIKKLYENNMLMLNENLLKDLIDNKKVLTDYVVVNYSDNLFISSTEGEKYVNVDRKSEIIKFDKFVNVLKEMGYNLHNHGKNDDISINDVLNSMFDADPFWVECTIDIKNEKDKLR